MIYLITPFWYFRYCPFLLPTLNPALVDVMWLVYSQIDTTLREKLLIKKYVHFIFQWMLFNNLPKILQQLILFSQQVSLPLWSGKCPVLFNWLLFAQHAYGVFTTSFLPLPAPGYSPRGDDPPTSSSPHHSGIDGIFIWQVSLSLHSYQPPVPYTLRKENIQGWAKVGLNFQPSLPKR